MSSYMKIGFKVVGRMAAERIIFLKNQDFNERAIAYDTWNIPRST